jgi:dolichyl-phosphate beta-glucosyltransferase
MISFMQDRPRPLVSVVVPVLDEAEIGSFTAEIAEILRGGGHSYEILLVNDGGPLAVDGTRVIEGVHGGKGRAVRDGVLATRGDVVVIVDADLQVLLGHLPRFIELVQKERYDVVIAERNFHVHGRKLVRFILSSGLLLAQRLFVFQSFRFFDTQCGLKALRGDAARAIAEKQRIDGGMYDIEYLYAAVKNRMRIAQVPVGLVREVRPSRIRLLRCLRTDPAALIATKWRGMRGHYRLGAAERRRPGG